MKLVSPFYTAVLIVLLWAIASFGTVEGLYPYYSEADFIAATPFSMHMESFEELPVDNTYNVHSTLQLADFSLVTDSPHLGVWDHIPAWNGHTTDGIKHVKVTDSDHNLYFHLNEPVRAFGLNITDWGDIGSGTLTFSNSNNALFTIGVTPLPQENELFFGLISDQVFESVTITSSIGQEGYSIDEVYYGIPEPASIGLLAIGSLALRKRRKA